MNPPISLNFSEKSMSVRRIPHSSWTCSVARRKRAKKGPSMLKKHRQWDRHGKLHDIHNHNRLFSDLLDDTKEIGINWEDADIVDMYLKSVDNTLISSFSPHQGGEFYRNAGNFKSCYVLGALRQQGHQRYRAIVICYRSRILFRMHLL